VLNLQAESPSEGSSFKECVVFLGR